MEPNELYLFAQHALQCVCVALDAVAETTEDQPGCPCRSFVSPGAPLNDCCDDGCEDHGQLTVHLVRMFPTTNFPSPDTTVLPCQGSAIAVEYAVRLTRCVPVMNGDGSPLQAALSDDDGRIQLTDMLTVYRAVSCCANDFGGRKRRRMRITSHTPYGEGSCRGSELRFVIDAGSLCACEEAS